MPAINVTKGKNESEDTELEEEIQKMEADMDAFFEHLRVKHDLFKAEQSFNDLQNYILQHDRILYSPISNFIYLTYEDSQEVEWLGTLSQILMHWFLIL